MQQLMRTRVSKKHVILFLAANPRDTDRLALDREARAIHVDGRQLSNDGLLRRAGLGSGSEWLQLTQQVTCDQDCYR